ncbi:MAG TPA: tetratricopeptide repeat protein, partial [Blastocatellia bacterium]|nr:tetratricopeptide repeat protein [Blastocatellia bacterium]
GDPGIRIDMIRLMAENGEVDEAKRAVELLVKMRPKDFYVQMLAGDVFAKDSPADAVPYYKTAAEIDPNNNNARVQLGASLIRSRQYQDGVPLLEKAIATEPDNVQARSNLATALFEQKEFPEAAQQFLWIVQHKPSLTIAFYFLAISLDKIGDCYYALKAYQEFENRANPAVNSKEMEDARIRVSLLNILVKRGKCKPPETGKKKK